MAGATTLGAPDVDLQQPLAGPAIAPAHANARQRTPAGFGLGQGVLVNGLSARGWDAVLAAKFTWSTTCVTARREQLLDGMAPLQRLSKLSVLREAAGGRH